MYECYYCGKRAVIWQNDYDYEDFECEGEGIVQTYHCTHCGAEIDCRIPIHTADEDIDPELYEDDLK